MVDNNKVLIVEDDEITALNLKLSLEKQGYEVIEMCDNINSAVDIMTNKNPNIVIIDISLQESNDGIDLAHIIKNDFEVPFIFLTAHSDEDIITQAKQTEPYGYIVKPFDPSSLHATMQMALFKYEMNITRQNNPNGNYDSNIIDELLNSKLDSDESLVSFSDHYHLDINESETFYKNNKIRLTKKENAFLRLLVAKVGIVVTFKQAMDYVWDKDGATENSVRTLVWRLRNKLETDIVKNASGIGYYIEDK